MNVLLHQKKAPCTLFFRGTWDIARTQGSAVFPVPHKSPWPGYLTHTSQWLWHYGYMVYNMWVCEREQNLWDSMSESVSLRLILFKINITSVFCCTDFLQIVLWTIRSPDYKTRIGNHFRYLLLARLILFFLWKKQNKTKTHLPLYVIFLTLWWEK